VPGAGSWLAQVHDIIVRVADDELTVAFIRYEDSDVEEDIGASDEEEEEDEEELEDEDVEVEGMRHLYSRSLHRVYFVHHRHCEASRVEDIG